MAFGDITITLRPIKFALLMNPSERKVPDHATRISLFLWRGRDCVMPNRHLG